MKIKAIRRSREIPNFENHERFLSKIIIAQNTGCWTWGASRMKVGYGKFGIGNTWYLAHRVSFSIFSTISDTTLVLDHICRNKSCVNPDHLREVTVQVNVVENSTSSSAINKQKTHCTRGHLFTSENSLKIKNGKACRICTNSYNRERARKKRAVDKINRGPKKKKTECKNGHDISGDNLKKRYRGMVCYVCYLKTARDYYERKKRRLQVQ